ncbi:hypothetical protein [Chitinimonas sp. BJYL2]|uniref:hypothetical protein n=1 Tax=Chitinimonas sp. BJYL2 TaxID=2976696 RepID=UPI0022B35C74|nr:hypothetical protein [Chitinimonas sp. BJYL2]
MKTFVRQEVLQDLSDLGSALTRLDERCVQEADSILIYLNGFLWMGAVAGDLPLDSARLQAKERLAGRALFFAPDPAWLCGHSAHPVHAGFYKPLRFEYDAKEDSSITALGEQDLQDLVAQAIHASIEEGLPRCIVHAPDGQHFELPSKAHASHFIRLSEAFDCVEAVQRTAYWVVVSLVIQLACHEDLPERRFLVDHPSMLLLGTHVNQIYGGVHQVLCLKGYPSETTLRAEASRILVNGPLVTAVIGITSTGKLARVLKELAETNQIELDICTVFAATDLPDSLMPLARLSVEGYFHSSDTASCEHCGQGNPPPIRVQGNSFLVGIAEIKEVKLSGKFFKEQRPFLDKYGAVPGALRVHFDDPNEVYPRHHAFGIDAAVLLKTPEFQDEVLQVLTSMDPAPDFVVIANHKASDLLKEIIEKWRDLPVVFLDQLNELQNLPQNPTVLVFDDKIVSGCRMRNLNVGLRAPRPHLWETFNHVHFFAPIVTTRSKKQLDQLRSGLTTNHDWGATLHHLYCVHLPDWHTSADCPWCQEKRWLEKLASKSGKFDSPLINRLALLSAGEPLDPMGHLAALPDGAPFPPLGAGSVAGKAGSSQLQVLMATASAVQQLRTGEGVSLNPYSLTKPTRLACFVFQDAYTEKLIACSILRSLTSDEVSVDMGKYLVTLIQAPHLSEGADLYQIELSMALIAGKLGTAKEIASAWEKLVVYGISEQSLSELGFLHQPQ